MKNLVIVKKNNKIRNPNIDFIRILGMFAIIITHLINHGQAIIKFPKYNHELKLLNIFCMWHVSSFGIISGLVGDKSHKFSNLLYLWIVTVFYSSIFCINYNKSNFQKYNVDLINNIFPVSSNRYWYFTSYFGIYPFLSFINSGISTLPKIQSKKCIYFIIGIFIIWASYYNDSFSLNHGYNSFSLLILYTIGCYIGKYLFYRKYFFFFRILICNICCILYILVSFICYCISIKNIFPQIDKKMKKLFRVGINSFPMVLQVFFVIIFISQIKFNKYLTSIITFIAPLTFDIYLIHENTYIRNKYIKTSFNKYSSYLYLSKIIILIMRKGIYIFCISLFIAYIRNIIFRIIKIKYLCFYFEIITTKIMYYFL